MVFFLIGLGLGSPDDITVKGLNALKTCSFVFLEHYTSILCDTSTKELETYYNDKLGTDIKIVLADRFMVEQDSDRILNTDNCIKHNTAFLVVGDPFAATTHTDLLLRAAKEKKIECEVIHNASIMNAVSCCGLQLYSFGATVSIPFWSEKWKPDSFYDKIKQNKSIGLHTLCLLDIKVKEISEENLIAGIRKYEPPRFMSVNVCIEQLLQIEADKEENVYSEETKCVGLARIGSKSQQIVYGTMKELMQIDFGKPLHSFVIPGNTHFIEEDVLKMYALDVKDSQSDVDDDEKNNVKMEVKKKEKKIEWNGIDFNGIWQLEKSDNLEEYLLSEEWDDLAIKAAMNGKTKITVQIIQDCDLMKLKMFGTKGSYSFNLMVGGESVKFKDLNGCDCETSAQWSEENEGKILREVINQNGRDYIVKKYLNKDNAKQMIQEWTNDKGVTTTRYLKKM